MSRIAQELREEGRKEGIAIGVKRTRERMIKALLENIPADNLLQFKALDITPEEIEAAKERKDD